MTEWEQAQIYERGWHAKVATNTLNEELKQLVYAKKMGIEIHPTPETPYCFKDYGKVLDVGGGEVSMLLKVENPIDCVVIDPLDYPDWVIERYTAHNIKFFQCKAETYTDPDIYDEVWCYNCLQHTEDPEKICQNMRKWGKTIRIFEWIENGISPGHIHNLTEKDLNNWLGGEGKAGRVDEGGCNGLYYAGIFLGNQ